ncbi:replication-relaxation family protein [Thermodesulfobacteriota bacterium]
MAWKIKDNDIKLLSYIAEYKFLTVKQLAALSQRSQQVIRRRLRLLRTKQLVFEEELGLGRGRPGRREHIHIITEKGLESLRDRKILSNHAEYITDKPSKSIFINHDLLVNWFFIHLLQIERDNPHFSTQHLTINSHNLKEGDTEKPLLQEWFPTGEDPNKIVSMIPDGVFTITNKVSEKTLLFFLEVDMGTETLVTTKRVKGDIRQKIINYQTLFHGDHYKRYEKIFNAKLNGFRLLFLANTPGRMKALCDLTQEMSPSKFIWVTNQDQMFSHGLSAEIWMRGGQYDKPPESILSQKLAFEAPVMDKIR